MARMGKSRPLALALGVLLHLAPPALAQDSAALADLLQHTHVHGPALDPQDPDRLLLATHHGLHALDLGTREITALGESRQDFMGFSVAAGDRLYASGHPEAGGNSGIPLSTDGGVSWSKLSDGVDGPVDFHQMAVSAADPQTLYGAHARGLQRSRDGGATWELVAPAPEGLIDLAAAPDRLFAATEAGLLVSEDGGASWVPAHPTQAPVSFVETGPEGLIHAFVLGEGLVRAEETDLDWTLVSGPLGGEYLLHFATDSTRAFAITGSGSLLVSDNGGAEWRLP